MLYSILFSDLPQVQWTEDRTSEGWCKRCKKALHVHRLAVQFKLALVYIFTIFTTSWLIMCNLNSVSHTDQLAGGKAGKGRQKNVWQKTLPRPALSFCLNIFQPTLKTNNVLVCPNILCHQNMTIIPTLFWLITHLDYSIVVLYRARMLKFVYWILEHVHFTVKTSATYAPDSVRDKCVSNKWSF